MINDLITIITVCFNSENDIDATLESVLSQTYQNIEYIIIDGASKDSTLDVIKRIVNKYPGRNVVIKTEPDKGVYDAMNKGIKIAHGEWINFMNSGDTFHDNHVVADCFENYIDRGESIVYGKIAEIDEKRNFTGVIRYGYEKCFPACHQGIFTRSSELKRDLYNISYKIIADYVFYYNLYKRNPNYLKTNIIIADYNNNGLSRNSYHKMTFEYLKFFYISHDKRFFKTALRYLKQLILK